MYVSLTRRAPHHQHHALGARLLCRDTVRVESQQNQNFDVVSTFVGGFAFICIYHLGWFFTTKVTTILWSIYLGMLAEFANQNKCCFHPKDDISKYINAGSS